MNDAAEAGDQLARTILHLDILHQEKAGPLVREVAEKAGCFVGAQLLEVVNARL
jgi:hypothetical protein